jgi:hypothetical protein
MLLLPHAGVLRLLKSLNLYVPSIILLCIVLVQVLPQVDLPDTAFHGGTAPIVAKSRVTARVRLMPRVAIPVWSSGIKQRSESDHERPLLYTLSLAKFLPILLCSLLC